MSVTNVLVKRQVPTSHQFKNEIIPALQSPLGPATILSGQRQATDRLGSESVTTQVWLEEHGFPMTQGFWHSCLMQASFEGQSASTLHSGSGSGSYAVQKVKKDWINLVPLKSKRCLKSEKAYVLNKKCIHLLEVGNCRYISLCGYLLHNVLQGHRVIWHKGVRSLVFESCISHQRSSHHWIDSLLLCKRQMDCLASLEGKHRFLCVVLACKLLYFHKLWMDKDPHTH